MWDSGMYEENAERSKYLTNLNNEDSMATKKSK
jgi:hypothetical protein